MKWGRGDQPKKKKKKKKKKQGLITVSNLFEKSPGSFLRPWRDTLRVFFLLFVGLYFWKRGKSVYDHHPSSCSAQSSVSNFRTL
jgi:hypothetical protein